MAVKFSGLPDERGFIMLHVDINEHSPELLSGVFSTLELLQNREDIFPHYTLESFEQIFSQYFIVLEKAAIPDTKRTLYLLSKKHT